VLRQSKCLRLHERLALRIGVQRLGSGEEARILLSRIEERAGVSCELRRVKLQSGAQRNNGALRRSALRRWLRLAPSIVSACLVELRNMPLDVGYKLLELLHNSLAVSERQREHLGEQSLAIMMLKDMGKH
jgi:hypothetical protein